MRRLETKDQDDSNTENFLFALCGSCHYLLAGTVALQCAGMLTVCVALRSTREGKQNSYVRNEIKARELRQAACRIYSPYVIFSL